MRISFRLPKILPRLTEEGMKWLLLVITVLVVFSVMILIEGSQTTNQLLHGVAVSLAVLFLLGVIIANYQRDKRRYYERRRDALKLSRRSTAQED